MEIDDLKGKKVKTKAPDFEPIANIDTDDNLADTIITSSLNGTLNNSILESFSTTAQTREMTYELIDTMGMDSVLASAVQTYAEDITQPNAKGDIFYVESDDADVANYVDYLLKRLDVDKQAFFMAYNLVKYGDVYIRLLRESDFKNSKIFGNKKDSKESLREDVNLIISPPGDHYALTFEIMRNPCEMFELTKFGKSMGYIRAAVSIQQDYTNTDELAGFYKYKMAKKDVDIYSPTEFVHACLQSSTSRSSEELDIFLNDKDYEKGLNAETFQVRRGAGIFNDLFKVWRQLSLLENSVMLNRVTRSAITRVIQMEVGDMPKNQVMGVTSKVKNMLENKSAFDVGNKMSEYTNPGPMENIVIIPTRNSKGALTMTDIGGEVDPKQLTDLDWFNNKLFGGIRIPKQYFGWTSDSSGFNGGTSLTIYSSRYGKAVKRMQKALCQAIEDMIHLIMIDFGKSSYINKFRIKLQPPVTQEEIDEKQNFSNTLRNISDIMTTLGDIQDPAPKLKILKSLLSECLTEQDILQTIQEEIDKLESEAEPESDNDENENNNKNVPPTRSAPSSTPEFRGNTESDFDLVVKQEEMPQENNIEQEVEVNETTTTEEEPDLVLPSFNELGIDGTINQ